MGPDGATAKCRRLIGYDDKADTFNVKKAIAPHNATVYASYAGLLRGMQRNPELADRVMEQLVEVNPDLPAAYLQRGVYYVATGEPQRGQRDIDKAYKLAPDDPDVLLTMAERSEANKRPERAREYLESGLKSHPKDPRFYQGLAGLEMRSQNFKEALTIVDQGLKAVPANESSNLLFLKSELHFMDNDIPGIRKTAEQMRKAGFPDAFIEWTEARILLAENKWYDASKALFKVQPKIGEGGPYADSIAVQLGLAYEPLRADRQSTRPI